MKNSDGTYGPTTKKHYYFPLYYHNKTAKKNNNKTRWVLTEFEQYNIFYYTNEIDSDPWHGYPIFSSSINISNELLEYLEKENHITKSTKLRIRRGKL